MNPYNTPCTPVNCKIYTCGTICEMQETCKRLADYQELKQTIRAEKEMRGRIFEQRAKGVDIIYKAERGNRHSVGQK